MLRKPERWTWVLVLMAILFLFAGQARADMGQVNTKFSRGLLNVGTGWMEIPYRIEKTWENDGPSYAFTGGLLQGIGRTVTRTLVGVYEIISSPFPGPENYEPVLKDPVYFLKDPRG